MSHLLFPSLIVLTSMIGPCEVFLMDNPDFDADEGASEGGEFPDPGPDPSPDPNGDGGTDEGSDEGPGETDGGWETDGGEETGEIPLDLPEEPEGSMVIDELGDTYTDQLAPHEAFGDASVLYIDPRKDTYIRLPNLADIPEGVELESLEMSLHCTAVGGVVQIRMVINQWDEGTLTSTSASSIGSLPVSTFVPEVGENVIELVDLLEPFQFDQADPGVKLRYESESVPDGGTIECTSREGGLGPSFVMTLSE